MEYLIETKELSYSYKNKEVLNNVSIQVPKNSIYGFIGANGAGKTTTIRILLSLLKVSQGKVSIFGKDITTDRINILSRVGALIEEPSVYQHLSGYDNLKVTCRYLGLAYSRIDEVLTITDLLADKNRKVKEYSLGMRQRLSIAMVLLNDPELLILDEPTNGLDPSGIHDMRMLMQRLCKEHGKTIFVSSHLLSELEKTVTHIAVIHNKQIAFQGSIDQLQHQSESNLIIRTSNNKKTLKTLVNIGYTVFLTQDDTLRISPNSDSNASKISKAVVESGIDLYQLTHHRDNLEEVFMDIIGQK